MCFARREGGREGRMGGREGGREGEGREGGREVGRDEQNTPGHHPTPLQVHTVFPADSIVIGSAMSQSLH